MQPACTLHDLRPEDKEKVAKLIRQVVSMGEEMEKLKAQSVKAVSKNEEKKKQLQRCNTEVVQLNAILQAKLSNAFAMLRTYQHKVKALEASRSAVLQERVQGSGVNAAVNQATTAASTDAAKASLDLAVSLALQVLQQVGHGSATKYQAGPCSPSHEPPSTIPSPLPSLSNPAPHDISPPSSVATFALPSEGSPREGRSASDPGPSTPAANLVASPAQKQQQPPPLLASNSPPPHPPSAVPPTLPNSAVCQRHISTPHRDSRNPHPGAALHGNAQVSTARGNVAGGGHCPVCTPRAENTCHGGDKHAAGQGNANPRLPPRRLANRHPSDGCPISAENPSRHPFDSCHISAEDPNRHPSNSCRISAQNPSRASCSAPQRRHPDAAGLGQNSSSPGNGRPGFGPSAEHGAQITGEKAAPDHCATHGGLTHQRSPKKDVREASHPSGPAAHQRSPKKAVRDVPHPSGAVAPHWSAEAREARGDVNHCAAGKLSPPQGRPGMSHNVVSEGQGRTRVARRMPVGDFDPCLMDLVAEVESITGHGLRPGVHGRQHRGERVPLQSPVGPTQGRKAHPHVAQWVEYSANRKVGDWDEAVNDLYEENDVVSLISEQESLSMY